MSGSRISYVSPTIELIGSFESTTLNTGSGRKLDYTFSQTPHSTIDDLATAVLSANNELS